MRAVILAAAIALSGACKIEPSEPSGCCKVCRDSKPCGDSCIPRSQTCRKGAGCACYGAEARADAGHVPTGDSNQ